MNSPVEDLHADASSALAPDDFARIARLTAGQVRELVDYGLLDAQQMDIRSALCLREAQRMGGDFDFDLFTVGFLAGYLRRIEELETEVRQLRAERPARTTYSEVSFTSISVRKG